MKRLKDGLAFGSSRTTAADWAMSPLENAHGNGVPLAVSSGSEFEKRLSRLIPL